MSTLEERLSGFAGSPGSILPLPGKGHTDARHRTLSRWGAIDLSFARMAEAHTDALAILAECDHEPRSGALYGVWASDAPPSRVSCERIDQKRWRIEGIKQFCSGAPLVDAALVTAHHSEGVFLFDVPIRVPRVHPQDSVWASPAFADTSTTAVEFDDLEVPDHRRLGKADWYIQRPGFWHGSIGPAACWAGGARSLIEVAALANRRDPHSQAHLGALRATAWGLHAILQQAGREIDADPQDRALAARQRGLMVRHLVERACAEVLDRFGRATGPHPLAYDAQAIRQHQSLAVYIRQCHGERDLAGIVASDSLEAAVQQS